MKPLKKHIHKDKEHPSEIECFEGLDRLNVLSAEGKERLKELKEKESFKPCPNKSWHHLGTTCKVCGQRG